MAEREHYNSVKTYENQLFSKVTSSGNESEDKYSTEYIEIDDVCLNISEDTSSIDKDAEADGYVAPKCCKHAVSEHKYSTEYTEIDDARLNISEDTSSVYKDAVADGYLAAKCCKHAVSKKRFSIGILISLCRPSESEQDEAIFSSLANFDDLQVLHNE